MIKTRTEKGDYDKIGPRKKIRIKGDEKVKIQNKGVMDFVIYTMANPPSNRGALLSHSSLSPPYGRPR